MGAYEAAIMSNHPLAYWPLQDRGDSARDLTTNGKHLTSTLTAEFAGVTPTQRGQLSLAQVNQYLTRSDNSGGGTSAYTMEGWFRVFGNYTSGVLMYVGASASNGYGLYVNTGLKLLHGGVVVGAGTYNWQSGDQWHHIMAAYSGGSYTMWRNGVQLISTTITAPNAPGAATTITAADGGGTPTWCAAAHCALYSTALTAADAMKHYQLGYGLGVGYQAAL